MTKRITFWIFCQSAWMTVDSSNMICVYIWGRVCIAVPLSRPFIGSVKCNFESECTNFQLPVGHRVSYASGCLHGCQLTRTKAARVQSRRASPSACDNLDYLTDLDQTRESLHCVLLALWFCGHSCCGITLSDYCLSPFQKNAIVPFCSKYFCSGELCRTLSVECYPEVAGNLFHQILGAHLSRYIVQ
jgi:hypothetical protein